MENLTEQECRTYLKKLQEICICQVCHGPLRSPDIMVCISGHVICYSCKARITTCAVCRSSFCRNKPVTLCQMVEVLPRFCRYNFSCNRILRDNDDHESWCEFRLIPCFFCRSSVECQAFLKHLSDAHNSKPRSMLGVDFQRENFLCDARLKINVGVAKLLDGHIFCIHYYYLPNEKNLRVNVEFWPTKSVDKTTFKFILEVCSVDNKVSFTFCQEVTITANVKTDIFNITDALLKSFNEKHVRFTTKISGLEVIKMKAETSCPITAAPSSSSSSVQSVSPSPAKRLRVRKGLFVVDGNK